jgi:hypothetical protein
VFFYPLSFINIFSCLCTVKFSVKIGFSLQKVLALEQQYNNMVQGKEKSPPPSSPLPPISSESFIPGTGRRNKPFKYHIPSSANQSQPSRISLQSILKKTPVYSSVQSPADKENLSASLNGFKNPEHIGTDGKLVECSPVNTCADASSTSFITSVLTDRFVGNSNVVNSSSVKPRVQFVTEPSDLSAVANGPLQQESNVSSQGKRTRFAAAKKRKLFCCNTQDML